MADTKISAMTAGTTIVGTEVVPGVQSSANVKFTINQIKTWTSSSPTLVTPVLGVGTATSLAIGGATIGSNALAVTGSASFTSTVSTLSTTVASLPTAGTAGRRAFVTDALAPVFGSAVAGSGAVNVPVYDTGAAWFVG